MKISWFMAVIVLYLVILGGEFMLTGGAGGASFNNAITANSTALIQPSLSSSSDMVSQAYTIFKEVGFYLSILIPALVLWSPTVFAGNAVWLWWFLCFPIDVGMVFGIMSVARGVHSS